ncbi:coiled-coil domain-containing protein 62 isoform X4 [Neofelis nebulosa]|uniref:coiled-coil domain-containing protein 62 isoform X4 n=1 Tax=Neofelis nebulosa TaxID=61452 RepID=UPI00272D55D1|nr:coiled-coil domain-containing protein 62 isoform X4 [Neofelis nebulosa]
MNRSATLFAGRQNIGSEVEISTIEKQRKELQLLIGELKDRDKELNDMVAVHQRQLLSWEEDRQKVLTLEERCSKLEGQKYISSISSTLLYASILKGLTGELHKRTEIIRSLTKKVKTLESNQTEYQAALQKTQLQLQEMAQKATHSSLLSEDLEDKDIIEAVSHIADCSGKFKMLEHALRDAKMVETCIVKEKQDYKQKLKALKIEVSKLKEDLNEKTTENNEQREEIIRLKQEKSCLHDELVFTAQREKRKDELLDVAKSKQERTDAELRNLRQIYVKQQSDLQFLNFNVENSQELLQIYDSKMEESKVLESSRDMCLSDLENNRPKVDIKREKNQKSLVKDPKFETTLVQQNRSDKSPCDVCEEKRLQVNTSFGGKSVISVSSLFTKDLLEKQKSWSLGGKMPMEAENKSTFCKIHAKSPKGNGIEIQNEEKQLLETSVSLSDEKQWHDVNVYLGLASCSGAKQPEKLNVECQDDMERSGVSCCHKNEACLGESDIWESKCCHPSNLIIEAPGHMSDMEWMSIFKPSKVQRIVRHKSVCTCAESASRRKYNSSTSELFAIQHSHCLGASKSAAREDERLIETGPSSDTKNSPKILLFNKEAPLSNEKDDFSPTSKLQRLLAESRQMVTDLELSTLLPISSESFSSSANKNLEVSEESAQKNTLLTN